MDTAGYDDELKLKEELLHGANFSNAAVFVPCSSCSPACPGLQPHVLCLNLGCLFSQDQVVELTALGRDFFSTIFSKFDKDQVPRVLGHRSIQALRAP